MPKLAPLLSFEGLYGDLQTRPAHDYIFLELIATRSKDFDWVVLPHLHTQLFQLFVIEKGKVEFQGESQTQQLEGPCLLLFPPSVLHGLVYSPDVQGQILTLSENLIEAIFPTSSPVWRVFTQGLVLNDFDAEHPFETILDGLRRIEKELFAEQAERDQMLKAHFTTLFLSIYRQSVQHEAQKNDNLSMSHFRRFQKLIKTTQLPKSIPDFAAELGITPVHLNRICRTVAGKPAIQLIQEHVVNEAKKYFLHTSYSISEIAYQLHFEYPNYFARLFKKYTGQTPLEFRNKARNK